MKTPPFEIWYRVLNYREASLNIREVRVTKSTKDSVWLLTAPLFDEQDFSSKREKRNSQHDAYFPSLEEAVNTLRPRAQQMRENAEEQLQQAKDFLEGNGRIFKADPIPSTIPLKSLKILV